MAAQSAGAADVFGISVAAGGTAINGLVALGLNYVTSVAAVRGTGFTLSGDMNVTSTMSGATDVFTTAITAGGVAVGASIDVALIRSRNEAIADLGGKSKAASMTVKATAADARATVLGITGSAGGAAVNVNLGLALNRAENRAKLGGTGDLTLSGGLDVEAIGGTGQARTALYSAAAGGVAVNVSLALSMLRTTQEAVTSNSGTIDAGSNAVTVKATQATPTAALNETLRAKMGTAAKVNDFLDKITNQSNFGDSMAKAYLFPRARAW